MSDMFVSLVVFSSFARVIVGHAGDHIERRVILRHGPIVMNSLVSLHDNSRHAELSFHFSHG